MLAESERVFGETGSYAGLTGELEMKDTDPIGYEKLFAACAAAWSPRARRR